MHRQEVLAKLVFTECEDDKMDDIMKKVLYQGVFFICKPWKGEYKMEKQDTTL